jgi:hypothetical protein
MTLNPPYSEILDIRGSKVLQIIDPDDTAKRRHQYLVVKDEQNDRYAPVYKRILPNIDFGDMWVGEIQPPMWELLKMSDLAKFLLDSPVIEYINWCPPGNKIGCIGGFMTDADGNPISYQAEQDYDGSGPKPVCIYPMLRVEKHDYWSAVTNIECSCYSKGTIRWYEAGYVPGYRICDKCLQHFQADGDVDSPKLISLVGRSGGHSF